MQNLAGEGRIIQTCGQNCAKQDLLDEAELLEGTTNLVDQAVMEWS